MFSQVGSFSGICAAQRLKPKFHPSVQGFPCLPGHLSSPLSPQFSSVPQSCLTLCNPMDCSTPGLHVYHQLPDLLKGSLVCCSLWSCKELDDLATEQQQLLPHLTISCLLPSQLYFLLQGRTETMLRFVYTELPNRAASKQMKCPYWLYALEFVCMFVFAEDKHFNSTF